MTAGPGNVGTPLALPSAPVLAENVVRGGFEARDYTPSADCGAPTGRAHVAFSVNPDNSAALHSNRRRNGPKPGRRGCSTIRRQVSFQRDERLHSQTIGVVAGRRSR